MFVLGSDRFDEARIVVLHVTDPRAHWPAGYLLRRERRQERFEHRFIRRLLSAPEGPGFGINIPYKQADDPPPAWPSRPLAGATKPS